LTSKRRVHGRIEVGNLQDLAMTAWGLFEIVALVVVGVFLNLVVTTIMIQIDLLVITINTSFCQFVFTYIFSLNSFLVEIGPFLSLHWTPGSADVVMNQVLHLTWAGFSSNLSKAVMS